MNGFQIRHKHWGLFQNEHSSDPRAKAGHWHLAHPGVGLCRFETQERAQGYIDLICRFFRGMVKPIDAADFVIEPFDAEWAQQLGGKTAVTYLGAKTWTTEYPTTSGYYWHRNRIWSSSPHATPEEELCVVLVSPDLSFYDCGSELMYDKSDIVSAEWYGPIEPPV